MKRIFAITGGNSDNGAASIFGEGSLTMTVAFVALITSVASIIVSATTRKKETVPITKTASNEEDN